MRRWLLWWRLALAGLVRAIVDAARTIAGLAQRAFTWAHDLLAAHALTDVRHPVSVWVGTAALAAGAVGGVLLVSTTLDRRAAALAGVASFMWAAIRWFVMRRALPDVATDDSAALRGSLARGLTVYAIALTPELRLIAWLGAAAMTGASLLRAGHAREPVLRAIALAWGLQAVVVAGGWLARNMLVAVVAGLS